MNQTIDPYQQLEIAAESSYGEILDAAWSSLYFLEYTSDRISSLNGVIGAGWRKTENNEILQITPGNYVAEFPALSPLLLSMVLGQLLQRLEEATYCTIVTVMEPLLFHHL